MIVFTQECVLCHRRQANPFGALCDICVSYALLPWWKKLLRRRP